LSRIASAGRIARGELARRLELLDRLGRTAVLEQRDAEVVAREARQRLGALELLEHRDRVLGPAGGEVDVRAQVRDVVADRRGHLAVDAVERVQRVGGLVLLEVDAREPVGRVVAHRVRYVRLEHGLDRAPGATVHAVVQLEVADRELRGADVVLQRVERGLVHRIVARELGV
jgi:hypothetical protein